jgi:hypothetical protein
MCEDFGGAGVQHAEQFRRAEFKSLYAYRGNGRKQDQSPSKARKVLRTGPLQFLQPRSRPLSSTPLLCQIARAYGIASTERRLRVKLP